MPAYEIAGVQPSSVKKHLRSTAARSTSSWSGEAIRGEVCSDAAAPTVPKSPGFGCVRFRSVRSVEPSHRQMWAWMKAGNLTVQSLDMVMLSLSQGKP
mmetsp:Transcript_52126/g.132370  ORF Transcript_52126/g.132370 Transcript_52126/m.132370 type:complete len:98 (+) Transcript_52126:172-465(+)